MDGDLIDTLTYKTVSLFFPISGFLTVRLEHRVANMYIIAVTIGNIISGILFVVLPVYFLNTRYMYYINQYVYRNYNLIIRLIVKIFYYQIL